LKRNNTRGQDSAYIGDGIRTRKLIEFLGFEVHTAPGEAEAECALLQREGLVDAVLSEDVDTLMFGSGVTLRDWSSEGRQNKTPTHVSLYDAKATKEGKSGLDREGMILVALMSGGDYDTGGIARCGAKIACEAARAGFGKSLCELSPDDDDGLHAWRMKLAHELQTNESHHFRQKNKAITVPEDFPKKEILRYYTHPAVSSEIELRNLRARLQWDRQVDVPSLRKYVAETFEWTGKIGAKKLIRGLAPAMLVYKLRERGNRRDSGFGDVYLTAANEMELVRTIISERAHFSTDGILELRLTYQPSRIVGLDLDAEVDNNEQDGRQAAEGDEDEENLEEYESDDNPNSKSRSRSPTKKGGLRAYDPINLDRVWIFRSIARVGVPLKVEDYEEELMLKQSKANSPKQKKTAAPKKTTAKGGMQKGALDRYFNTNKPSLVAPSKETSKLPAKEDQPQLPPVYLAPALAKLPAPQKEAPKPTIRPRREHRKVPQTTAKPQNPWAITSSQSSQPSSQNVARVTKSIAQSNYEAKPALSANSGSSFSTVASYDVFSSPPSLSNKHPRDISPPAYISNSLDEEIPTSPLAPPEANKKRAPDRELLTKGGMRQTKIDLGVPRTKPVSSYTDINKDNKTYSSDTDDELPILGHLLSPSRKKSSIPSLKDPPMESFQSKTKAAKSMDGTATHEVIEILSSPPAPAQKTSQLPQLNGGLQEPQRQAEPLSFSTTRGKQKLFIAPHESLPGAWKECNEQELKEMERRGRKPQRFYRKSEVEVLDMTEY